LSLVMIAALLIGVVADDFELPPDIVYGTMNRTGRLAEVDAGGLQVVLSVREGDHETFWSFDPLLNSFLSLHTDEQAVLEIEDVETWMPEEEAMVRLLRVVDATIGEITFRAWSDSLEAGGTPGEVLEDPGTPRGEDDCEGDGGR